MSKNKIKRIIFTEEMILDVIREMAYSQGFYGRLLESLLEAKEEDPKSYYAYIKAMQDAGVSSYSQVLDYIEGF